MFEGDGVVTKDFEGAAKSFAGNKRPQEIFVRIRAALEAWLGAATAWFDCLLGIGISSDWN
jgi:hypothetical protein